LIFYSSVVRVEGLDAGRAGIIASEATAAIICAAYCRRNDPTKEGGCGMVRPT
jgi:hypothetical protein